MEFFDSHSHYNDEKFNEDRYDILKKIQQEGVTSLIIAGYNTESSKLAINIAEKYNNIYTIVGISPNDVGEDTSEIERIAQNKKVVAIGEIGLDYYWNKDNKDLQKQIFIQQIEIANSLDLPIVIHCRDAIADTLEILKRYKCNKAGVFHCCMLNPELVKEAVKLGYYISFAGPITFKNSKNAETVIKLVPNEKILIETDCPYLAPEPKRGTRNDSRNLKYIAQKIADVKEKSLEEIAKITYDNAKRVFEID